MQDEGTPLPGGGGSTGTPARPPVSLTTLVGRERELAELQALVASHRLVTVTGVGGSGKTRLAAELALRLDRQERDGVAWVDLTACPDPHLVAQRAATALAIRSSLPPLDALAHALAGRKLLLVLDDCEHLIGAVADLAQTLLLRCPSLTILATSREPLQIAGELVWPIPQISLEDAAQLFADRAAAVDRTFTVTDENRSAVAEICRRLDAIPLAIELAAARVRVLAPEQIATRIEDRFAMLTGGARTALPRHRTLRAAVDWSYALLPENEQALLARLSVFPCSFRLEAAESVADADLDLLTSLVDKSLVVAGRTRGAARYHLLETIRTYAGERLGEHGRTAEMRGRHARAFLAWARATPIDPMRDVVASLAAFDLEHDNLRAALTWSIEHEPDAIALPLAAACRWYWYFRILWSEGLRWFSLVLARSSATPSRERAAVLAGAGACAGYVGDFESARRWLEEAEAMWRAIGDERELALTVSALAQALANGGETDAAAVRAEESVRLARANATPWEIAYCLANAAAFVAERRGDLDAADRAFAEAEAIWSTIDGPLGLPFALSARALLALRRGEPAMADRLARSALTVARRHGETWFCARAIRVLALTAGEPRRAARLLGASDAMLRSIGARMLLHETSEHQRLLDRLLASLGPEALDDAVHEGVALPFEAACDAALDAPPIDASAPAAARLHVADLGPLQITLGGEPLETERVSHRARELLVFLLTHPTPTRDAAGAAFWPDATADQVKNSFHVTLHRVRKLLGGSGTVIAEGARYLVTIPHVVESRLFETSAHAAIRRASEDPAALEAAIALYRGDFLQGEDAGEWVLPMRAQLRQLHLRALFALGQAYESRGRYTDAAEIYTRMMIREPLHEAAARQLMICRARLGARGESIQVYRQLERRLREDLQASPEAETATLYRRLRENAPV